IARKAAALHGKQHSVAAIRLLGTTRSDRHLDISTRCGIASLLAGQEGETGLGSLQGGKKVRRTLLGAVIAFCSLGCITPAVSSASVTLGQLAPGSSPPLDCANPDPYDVLQPTVTSGNTYVVPASVAKGTISAWSHNAGAGAGQSIAFKV